MGRIVVTEFISLDGVVQAPGGEEFKYQNWTFDFDRGEAGNTFKLDETRDSAALLLGRRTYEAFAAAWPEREGDFAELYNSMPKYVVSRTLTDPTWNNTRVLSGGLVADVTRLKGEVDGDISVAGSIELVQGLIEADLVDEIHLMTFPVLLGTGRRLFGETPDRTTWRLTEATTVGEGVLITIFQRAPRP